MKKKTIFAILLLALFCSTFASAQSKSKSSKITIIDFVNWFVADSEDEFTSTVHDAWQKYLKHKPLDENTIITVDVKNGYMRYENNYPEDNYSSYLEICYWNCADGKHKLVAYNIACFEDGKPFEGQFDGISFTLYDNATRVEEPISPEEIGLDIFYGIDACVYGYDAEKDSYFWESRTGKVTYMTKEEWEEWHKNRPINTFTLPRAGKDIILTTHRGTSKTSTTWTWDGEMFNH